MQVCSSHLDTSNACFSCEPHGPHRPQWICRLVSDSYHAVVAIAGSAAAATFPGHATAAETPATRAGRAAATDTRGATLQSAATQAAKAATIEAATQAAGAPERASTRSTRSAGSAPLIKAATTASSAAAGRCEKNS
jgi:hypothetical protein